MHMLLGKEIKYNNSVRVSIKHKKITIKWNFVRLRKLSLLNSSNVKKVISETRV